MAEQFNAGEIVGRVRFDVPQSELDKISQLQSEISGVAQAMQSVSAGGGRGGGGSLQGVLNLTRDVEQAKQLNEEIKKVKDNRDDAPEKTLSEDTKSAMRDFPRLMRQIGISGGLISATMAGIVTIANFARPQNEVAQTMEGALREISDAQKSIIFAMNADRFASDAQARLADTMAVADAAARGSPGAQALGNLQYDVLEISMLGERTYQILSANLATSERMVPILQAILDVMRNPLVGGLRSLGSGNVGGALSSGEQFVSGAYR